jgi:hypothetical protein
MPGAGRIAGAFACGRRVRPEPGANQAGRLLLDANPSGNEVRFAVREIERPGAAKGIGAFGVLRGQLVGAVRDRGVGPRWVLAQAPL